jgi:predicted O-methyltransferase YrrM
MTPDGRLHTIEMRESDARVAQEYFNLSGLQHQISLHKGNAMDIIPGIRETWDLVFIDADKVHYIDYYRMVCPQVRPGGIIIADNVLFHGEVLQDNLKGKNATAIQSFNDYIQQDETVEKVMLTVRDGLLLIRKK